MKKFIYMFLIAVLTLCISIQAYSEGFSLRGGIEFGMSREEVRNCEKQYKEDAQFLKELPERIIYYPITLGGLVNTYLDFFFDQNDSLNIIGYRIHGEQDGSLVSYFDQMKDFTNIENILRDKYGVPQTSYEMGIKCPVKGYGIENMEKLISVLGGKVHDYNEWLIPMDKYYLKIEQVFYSIDTIENHELYYQQFSIDEVSILTDGIENYEDEKQQSIQNDF